MSTPPPAQPAARLAEHPAGALRAFSLLELLVVIAVTLVLTGLLVPAMSGVRENANRIICSSHLRQLGFATQLYYTDHDDRLMVTAHLRRGVPAPQELQSAYRAALPTGPGGVGDPDDGPSGSIFDDDLDGAGWDGLGLLFHKGYCRNVDCFYCPSHRGEHPKDRYEQLWHRPDGSPIYTNYHYAGDMEWVSRRRRSIERDDALVLATDGLRTRLDFNHDGGMNVLAGDGSVVWQDDNNGILGRLPVSMLQSASEEEAYSRIWTLLDSPR